MTKRVDLDVIVVNWNVKERLGDCIRSTLQACKSIEARIWVIDNDSTDGSQIMVKNEFSNIRLIENNENIGFAKANNQVLKRVKGEYVLLLNPDTILTEDAITKMLVFMEAHSNVGIVGPRINYLDGRIQYECARGLPTVSKLFKSMLLLKKGAQIEHGDYTKSRKVDCISGACMMIREKALREIGLLDETLFMYLEDIDFCMRAVKKRWTIYYLADALVIHHSGESTKKSSRSIYLQAMQIIAELKFIKKYYSSGYYLLAKGAVIGGSLIRLYAAIISTLLTVKTDIITKVFKKYSNIILSLIND